MESGNSHEIPQLSSFMCLASLMSWEMYQFAMSQCFLRLTLIIKVYDQNHPKHFIVRHFTSPRQRLWIEKNCRDISFSLFPVDETFRSLFQMLFRGRGVDLSSLTCVTLYININHPGKVDLWACRYLLVPSKTCLCFYVAAMMVAFDQDKRCAVLLRCSLPRSVDVPNARWRRGFISAALTFLFFASFMKLRHETREIWASIFSVRHYSKLLFYPSWKRWSRSRKMKRNWSTNWFNLVCCSPQWHVITFGDEVHVTVRCSLWLRAPPCRVLMQRDEPRLKQNKRTFVHIKISFSPGLHYHWLKAKITCKGWHSRLSQRNPKEIVPRCIDSFENKTYEFLYCTFEISFHIRNPSFN